MRSVVASVAGALVLLVSTAMAAQCTPEQEAAYTPYRMDPDTLGCDLSTFDTCSDACLARLQVATHHAPDCMSTPKGFGRVDLRETAEATLRVCERARADMTNKYFPQLVADAPEYSMDQMTFLPDMDLKHPECGPTAMVSTRCSDACLAVIEDVVTRSPVCRIDGKGYTLAEREKVRLVRCLKTRNQDLASNKVLNTVATVGGGGRNATNSHINTNRTTVPVDGGGDKSAALTTHTLPTVAITAASVVAMG